MYNSIDYLEGKGHRPVQKYRASEHPRNLWFKCLYHEPDHDPSMQVSVETGLWRCWSCDASGDLATLVLREEFGGVESKANWYHVMRRIDSMRGTNTSSERPSATPYVKPLPVYANEGQQRLMTETMYWWHQRLWDGGNAAFTARLFLIEGRGALHSVLQEAQLGYAPSDRDGSYCYGYMDAMNTRLGKGQWEEDALSTGILLLKEGVLKFRNVNRLTFSCLNEHRRVLFYQARVVGQRWSDGHFHDPKNTKYKYLNPGKIGRYSFSLPVERPAVEGTVVTEAPLGPVVLAGYDIPTMATLGTGFDARLLDQYADPFVCAQDNDEPKLVKRGNDYVWVCAGEEQAQAFMKMCQQQGRQTHRFLPDKATKGIDEMVHVHRHADFLVEAMQRLKEEGDEISSPLEISVVY